MLFQVTRIPQAPARRPPAPPPRRGELDNSRITPATTAVRRIAPPRDEKEHSRCSEPSTGKSRASLPHQCERGRLGVAAIRIDIAAGSVYLRSCPSGTIDKRSSARLFRDGDYSARAQANAGSEPRDPFWWSAALVTRAAFAARPGAKLISVPLDGGSLSVSGDGGMACIDAVAG
jgi:hypothetical protein